MYTSIELTTCYIPENISDNEFIDILIDSLSNEDTNGTNGPECTLPAALVGYNEDESDEVYFSEHTTEAYTRKTAQTLAKKQSRRVVSEYIIELMTGNHTIQSDYALDENKNIRAIGIVIATE